MNRRMSPVEPNVTNVQKVVLARRMRSFKKEAKTMSAFWKVQATNFGVSTPTVQVWAKQGEWLIDNKLMNLDELDQKEIMLFTRLEWGEGVIVENDGGVYILTINHLPNSYLYRDQIPYDGWVEVDLEKTVGLEEYNTLNKNSFEGDGHG